MDDLKQYKEVWQKQPLDTNQLDTSTISKMIRKKSSSIVKWIFYISIMEFVLLTLLNIFGNTDWNQLKDLGLYRFMIVVSVISYVIPVVFIFLFYKNYKSIRVTNSTKALIKSIIRTRQTVKYYIYSVLAIYAFSVLYGFGIAIHSPDYEEILRGFGEKGTWIVWTIVVLFVLIFLGVFFLIYQLLYGILLKKLKENYRELVS